MGIDVVTTLIDIPRTGLRGGGMGGRSQSSMAGLARGIFLNVSVNTKFRKFQRTYRDDRVAFVYDCMPKIRDTFAPYQEEILAWIDEGSRRVAVRGPHGLGKTLIAAVLVHHTILTTESDCIVPTLASVWRQLERYLWPEIHKVAKLLDWHKIGRDPYTRDELMVQSLRTNDGLNEAFAVASGEAALIEGAHASRLFYIFDESKSVDDCMWDAAEGAFATEGTIMLDSFSGECWWFAISTPGKAMGRFYDIHSKKGGYEDWRVRHVTLEEAVAAGRIGFDWAGDRARQWGKDSAVYKNRVLGEFATGVAEGVIPLDWIEAAFDRFRKWDERGRPGEGLGDRIMGVDAARMGIDKTVFAERVGIRVEKLHKYTRQKTTVSAGYLKPHAERSSAVHIEMDSGLGAAIYDTLDSTMDPANPTMNLVAIYMGAGTTWMDKTNTFRFSCVRSAAWWNMRQLLDPENGHDIVLCPDDMLLGDLAAPGYEIKFWRDYLTIFVEAKPSVKKSLGRSTDDGDAVVLAFWKPVSGAAGVVV